MAASRTRSTRQERYPCCRSKQLGTRRLLFCKRRRTRHSANVRHHATHHSWVRRASHSVSTKEKLLRAVHTSPRAAPSRTAAFRSRSGCFIPSRTATVHCVSAAAMRPRTTGPGVDPSSPATAAATATTPQPGARLSARSPAHARSGSGSASVPTRAVAATPTRAPSPAWHQSYPGCAPKLHALGARASSPTTAAAASSDSLGDYVAASPVAPLLGLTPSAVEATRSAQWDLWAERLTQQLQLPASLDAAARCVCARHTVHCHSHCRLRASKAQKLTSNARSLTSISGPPLVVCSSLAVRVCSSTTCPPTSGCCASWRRTGRSIAAPESHQRWWCVFAFVYRQRRYSRVHGLTCRPLIVSVDRHFRATRLRQDDSGGQSPALAQLRRPRRRQRLHRRLLRAGEPTGGAGGEASGQRLASIPWEPGHARSGPCRDDPRYADTHARAHLADPDLLTSCACVLRPMMQRRFGN